MSNSITMHRKIMWIVWLELRKQKNAQKSLQTRDHVKLICHFLPFHLSYTASPFKQHLGLKLCFPMYEVKHNTQHILLVSSCYYPYSRMPNLLPSCFIECWTKLIPGIPFGNGPGKILSHVVILDIFGYTVYIWLYCIFGYICHMMA